MISTNHEGEDKSEDASPDNQMSSKANSIRATENNLKDSFPKVRESLIRIDETTDEFGVIYKHQEPVDDM